MLNIPTLSIILAVGKFFLMNFVSIMQMSLSNKFDLNSYMELANKDVMVDIAINASKFLLLLSITIIKIVIPFLIFSS